MNEDLQFPYNFAIKGNKDYFVSMKLHKLFKDLGAVNLDSENRIRWTFSRPQLNTII